jgi:uncharacterized Zn-finger protein
MEHIVKLPLDRKCKECNVEFTSLASLHIHVPCNAPMIRASEKKETGFVCNYCGKCCGSLSKLRSHIQIHMENEYECQICRKQFATRYAGIIHMSVHSGKILKND